MFNPDTAPASAYMPSFETTARSLSVVPITAPVHSDVEIETAIIALRREPRGGLVVVPDIFTLAHRASIMLAAARNNVPAVSYFSAFAREGGLLSKAATLQSNIAGRIAIRIGCPSWRLTSLVAGCPSSSRAT
jgi:putative ABC transport system substrate-binding protein